VISANIHDVLCTDAHPDAVSLEQSRVTGAVNMQALHTVTREMPILTEMPAVAVPAQPDDSVYPALGWQQEAVARGVQRLAAHRQHLHDIILAARYAHAPIGPPPQK
jgi:hypothetical protein